MKIEFLSLNDLLKSKRNANGHRFSFKNKTHNKQSLTINRREI